MAGFVVVGLAVASLAVTVSGQTTPPVPASAQIPATAPEPARAGNVVNGRRLYEKQTCAYCHGTAGGGGSTGPHLAAIARTPDSFIRYVRRPTGAMPAFTGRVLSDEQLTDIFAYVKTLSAPKPVDEIPLLKQMK
jgi:mono/diheme cytochrome c family protein